LSPAGHRPLQQAVLGSGTTLAESSASSPPAAGLASERFTTIGVVSTGPGEGKTTVALGLTAALARTSDQRALLLEADLRQPSIERYLGLPRLGGVSEYLAGAPEASSCARSRRPGSR
jgi:Mrp family chromosome partitioning ATPase